MILEYLAGGDRPGLIWHAISVYGDGALAAILARGGAAIETDRPDFDVVAEGYVESGTLKRRPVLPIAIDKRVIAADDADAAAVSGLPDPCTVWIDDAPHAVTGGTLALTSPMPAVYRLRVDQWPAMPFEADIRAE